MENNNFFNRAKVRAGKLLDNNRRLKQLFDQSADKLAQMDKSSINGGKLIRRLKTLTRLSGAYARGAYRNVNPQNMLLMIAALIYFVTPVDVIPDFIPVSGLIDDFTVVIWVYNKVQEEIDKFIVWEEAANK